MYTNFETPSPNPDSDAMSSEGFEHVDPDPGSDAEHDTDEYGEAHLIEDAEARGLSPEEVEEVVKDFNESFSETESAFDKLDANMAEMAEIIEGIGADLGEISETLKAFFEQLVELMVEIEHFIEQIAQETDEVEKQRLKSALQAKINQFGALSGSSQAGSTKIAA